MHTQKHNEESRRKMREARLKGLLNGTIKIWNKGMKLSEEHKKKLSLAHLGQQCWNKGGRLSKEMKKKLSLAHKGKKLTEEHKQKLHGRIPWNKGLKGIMAGKDSPHWKGGITSFNKLERTKFRKIVQKQVFKRDNYTCQMCGKKGCYLQVDHIQSWKDYVELRFDINNCRTLCMDCHYFITFGKPKPKEIKTWGHNFYQIERGLV